MNTLIALAASAAYLDLSANATLDDDEEEEPSDDDSGEEAEEPAPKPKKKKVKKGGKKIEKSAKASKSNGKSDKNVVRLKDLAKAAKLTEAVTRKKLRDAEVPRGEGRWSWELGSKSLKLARKALGLSTG